MFLVISFSFLDEKNRFTVFSKFPLILTLSLRRERGYQRVLSALQRSTWNKNSLLNKKYNSKS